MGAKQLGWGVSKGVPPSYYDSEKSMYVKKFWTQFKTVPSILEAMPYYEPLMWGPKRKTAKAKTA